MKTVVISTLGCKVNQFESAAFKSAFEEHGLAVSTGDDADIVVVNTCAVTASAGAQSRRLVLRLLRRHPLVNLRLLHNPRFALACFAYLVLGMALMALSLWLFV